MFSTYTWNDYFIFTLTVLFVYYTFIGIRYFKWELLALAGIHRQSTGFRQVQAADLKQQIMPISNNAEVLQGNLPVTDQTFTDALKAEITALLSNSPETISSTLLSDSLNAVIRKYPSLSQPERQDLGRFIYNEATTHFPGLLSENEVEQLWFG